MFDETIRKLNNIKRNGGKIPIPVSIPTDNEGYFD